MTALTANDECLFCCGPDVGPEHAWPKWLGKLRTGIVGPERFKRPIRVEYRSKPSTYAQTFNIEVERFCYACNHGWMSRMENEIKPLLSPMVRGESVSLTSVDRRALATWAYKTALVMECLLEKSDITTPMPPAAYRQFYEDRVPPVSGVRIWTAAYSGTDMLGRLWPKEIGTGSADAPGAVYRLLTFTCYRAVFQILSHVGGRWVDVGNHPAADRELVCLWPTQYPRVVDVWPPNGDGLTDEQLRAFETRLSFRGSRRL